MTRLHVPLSNSRHCSDQNHFVCIQFFVIKYWKTTWKGFYHWFSFMLRISAVATNKNNSAENIFKNLKWFMVLKRRCLQDSNLRRLDYVVHGCCQPQDKINPVVSASQLMQRSLGNEINYILLKNVVLISHFTNRDLKNIKYNQGQMGNLKNGLTENKNKKHLHTYFLYYNNSCLLWISYYYFCSIYNA